MRSAIILVLQNARVLGELTPGFKGDFADIVIDGDRILDILPAGSAVTGEIINVNGKSVLPGFIDAHVHLDLSGMDTWQENTQSDAFRVLRAVSLAQDNLKKGFTTLRDLGDRNNIIIDLSNAVRNGFAVAPDIFASGMIISPTERGNNFFESMYAEADGKYEVVKAVRKQVQAGATWIKYMGTGAIMNPGSEPGASIYLQEEVNAIVQTADMLSIPVVGHCHGASGMIMAINAGVRTIEHATILDQKTVDMLKASTRTFIVPTVTPPTYWATTEVEFPEHYIRKSKKIFDIMVNSITMAYKNGLKIGFGTDAGVYDGSHGDNSYEFKSRCKYAGMKPLDVLVQATKNNAEILMIDNEVGTLEIGKKANIVVIDGNPDEDIYKVDNVVLVIKGGKKVNI